MKLPPAIEIYFAADRRMDASALTSNFAANAKVTDEGVVHSGHDQIRDWWLAAKAKYQYIAEPIEVTRDGTRITVRCRVSGQFPNSPATIDFAFTLSGDKISNLEIG
ncbi:nuclear transport factor 2 family protein [Bradyrhizobium sp. dw_411]|uniref:nuclear transport factor 2 family protein n=1 Tax=Bradyrhizobium sp. dw_411 TaxID=2720082 RepID=UPI001BCAA453|nr:nuclear transport factor 2 family protein [Bradyrhizobium sp. dw_411]